MGKMVLDTAADALQIFSEQYGTYPYIELDMVSTPMNAGGMEYAGAAAMSLFLYDPEVSISGIPGKIFLESATAHEVAHQWFFNQVMNDQLDEPWLDEGFAQYLTYVYYLEKYGSEAAASYRDSWDKRWARLDFAEVPIGKPAGDYAREEYSPIIYGRAPIFIETLAAEMGAETFAEFMRAYVDMYRWETVTTDDFIRMAEESCACELDALFETWWQVD
jgi:aminopeptidase N